MLALALLNEVGKLRRQQLRRHGACTYPAAFMVWPGGEKASRQQVPLGKEHKMKITVKQ